jgi:hypothetical protein
MSTMQSKRPRAPGADPEKQPQPPREVIDRLAGLLPEGALDDAVRKVAQIGSPALQQAVSMRSRRSCAREPLLLSPATILLRRFRQDLPQSHCDALAGFEA